MTTTLFAIFGIALLATLAWVITRIVNIFVELEELHQRVRIQTDQIDCLQKAHKLIVRHLEQVDELIAKAAEEYKETIECLKLLEENQKIIQGSLDIIIAYLDDERAKANKPSEAHKEKMDRVVKYIVLRNEGLSIRKAGEEVGVSYPTAKRYERIRKEQSNGDN